MRWVLALFVWAVVSMAGPAAAEDAPRRLALIFGNADYNKDGTLFTSADDSYRQHAPRDLQKTLHDSTDMEAALIRLGFTTFKYQDTTKAEMLGALDRFAQQLDQAGPDAIAVIYYSGHAIQIDGVSLLIPVRANLASGAIRQEAIALPEVLSRLNAPARGINIVVLDACRENPWSGAARLPSAGSRSVDSLNNTIIAYATADGALAGDGADDARNSPYTEALLRRLPDKVTVLDLFNAVAQEVQTRTQSWPKPQSPRNYTSSIPAICLNGCLVRGASAPPPVAGVPFADCDAPGCPVMVRIEGSHAVQMGASPSEVGYEAHEDLLRFVDIPDFIIGKFEVTANEYNACVAAGGCARLPGEYASQSGNAPVVGVTWNDAQAFVKWLPTITHKVYRLPSEAEWEFAARAGSAGRFPDGMTEPDLCDVANHADAGLRVPHRNAACTDHYGAQPAPVGSFAANKFGLNDMQGNVWEWVQDCYAPRYAGAPSDGSAYAPATCASYVDRGGGWNSGVSGLRFADRGNYAPGERWRDLGFRVARAP